MIKTLRDFTSTYDERRASWRAWRPCAVEANAVSAFTLLETLVAVAILIMSLLGPFSIAQQSLRSAYYARDQVTAYYLAQEGIEFVRAYRDQNYLSGASWLTGISACTATFCTVDFTKTDLTTAVTVCPNGVCPVLLVSPTGGLFNYTTGTASKFTRKIQLTTVQNMPDEIIVNVTVSWVSSGIARTFSLQERLFNWL